MGHVPLRPRFSAARAKALLFLALLGVAVHPACGGPEDRTRVHRTRADEYLKAGQPGEARIEYESALQGSPNDPLALLGLAKAWTALGQRDQAAKTLGKLLETTPNHPEALGLLAETSLTWGRYTRALALSRQLLAADPSDSAARGLEAKALSALGRRADAAVSWERFLASPHADAAAFLEAARFELSAGDRSGARRFLEQGLVRFPSSPSLNAARGEALVGEDDAAAQVAFGRAETLAPADVQVWASRARALVREGKLEEAWRRAEEVRCLLGGDQAKRADLAVERARLLSQLGDLAGARAVLETARKASPDHPGLGVALAEVLITDNRTAEARSLLPLAGKLDPTGRTESLLEARILLHSGISWRALQITQALRSWGDESVETRLLHARALGQQGLWPQAQQEYRALLTQAPRLETGRADYATLLAALGDYRGALAQLDSLPKPWRETPRIQYLRTRVLLGKGALAEARSLAETLAKRQPQHPTVLGLLGDLARAEGHYGEAQALYRSARKAAPRDADLLFAQTEALAAGGAGVREVLAVLDDYLATQGEDVMVINRAAGLLLQSGDFAEAARRVSRSTQLAPNYWKTRVLRGRILLAEGQDAKAIGALEEAIRLNPRDPEAYNWLAGLYRKRGDPGRAEATYRRVLHLNPGDPQTTNNLADLHLERRQFAEAVQLAREALAGAPGNARIEDTLGWALELAGRSKEAAPHLEAAHARLPNEPEALFHWAVNLRSRGRHEEARRALQRVVARAPKSDSAGRAREILLRSP